MKSPGTGWAWWLERYWPLLCWACGSHSRKPLGVDPDESGHVAIEALSDEKGPTTARAPDGRHEDRSRAAVAP